MNAYEANPGGDPLAGLRPYHLPDPPSWWPPAPGWWLLMILILLACLAVVWWVRRRQHCRAASRQALRELNDLRQRAREAHDAAGVVREMSKLLRRFAVTVFPRRDVASLTGENWLRFLDQRGGDGRFADGTGRLLLDAPYRRVAGEAHDELAALIEAWIRRNGDACR